jgi:hypothetical protein
MYYVITDASVGVEVLTLPATNFIEMGSPVFIFLRPARIEGPHMAFQFLLKGKANVFVSFTVV